MEFIYEPELQEYMKSKGKKNIVVEVVSSECSDFDITELHVHFVNDRQTKFFKEEKHFRSVQTSMGEVLLPRYVLEYDDVIRFGLKKVLCFYSIKYEGIRL